MNSDNTKYVTCFVLQVCQGSR